jgi:hypothetical protein
MKAALTLKCNNMTVAVAMTLCVREEVVVMVVVVLEVVCKLTSQRTEKAKSISWGDSKNRVVDLQKKKGNSEFFLHVCDKHTCTNIKKSRMYCNNKKMNTPTSNKFFDERALYRSVFERKCLAITVVYRRIEQGNRVVVAHSSFSESEAPDFCCAITYRRLCLFDDLKRQKT